MALTPRNIGTTPDGRPLFHFVQTDARGVPVDDPGCDRSALKPVVITGPIRGQVTTSDGTVYDVTDDVIEVDTPEHAGEVAHLIGTRFAGEGHPHHSDGQPFVHDCTDACGAFADGQPARKRRR